MSGGRGSVRRALARLHTSRVDYANHVPITSTGRGRNRAHSKTRLDQPGRARKRREGVVRDHPDSRNNARNSPNLGDALQLSVAQRSHQARDLLGSAAAPEKGAAPTPMPGRSSAARDSVLARGGRMLDRSGEPESTGHERDGELARLRAELAAARSALLQAVRGDPGHRYE